MDTIEYQFAAQRQQAETERELMEMNRRDAEFSELMRMACEASRLTPGFIAFLFFHGRR